MSDANWLRSQADRARRMARRLPGDPLGERLCELAKHLEAEADKAEQNEANALDQPPARPKAN